MGGNRAMSSGMRADGAGTGATSRIPQLLGDRRGVAAIEFAFIAPLLLCMYLVTMEVSQAIEVNKKMARVGSMVADLVTQQDKMSPTELDAIMDIAQSTLQPYNRSTPVIEITAIEISSDTPPSARVAWSRKLSNGSPGPGLPKNTTVTVPEKLNIADSFLLRVETGLGYKPVIIYTAAQKDALGLAAAFDGIAMKESYYLRPRMSNSIPCADC